MRRYFDNHFEANLDDSALLALLVYSPTSEEFVSSTSMFLTDALRLHDMVKLMTLNHIKTEKVK